MPLKTFVLDNVGIGCDRSTVSIEMRIHGPAARNVEALRAVQPKDILSKVRMLAREKKPAEMDIGSVGGFQLACAAGPTWRNDFETSLVIRRTGLSQAIELEDDLTATGLIARIEHLLERMPSDLQEQERKVDEAARRLAGYKDRLGQPFPLQGELDGKLDQLAILEADLAGSPSRYRLRRHGDGGRCDRKQTADRRLRHRRRRPHAGPWRCGNRNALCAGRFRERGVGRRIMRAAATQLAAGGCGSVFVWVLRDDPSRWFYRHLGGQPTAEGQTRVAGVSLDQVAYAWDPIDRLLATEEKSVP